LDVEQRAEGFNLESRIMLIETKHQICMNSPVRVVLMIKMKTQCLRRR